jgi:hypothetical protein
MVVISSSGMQFLTGATWRYIPEDGIRQGTDI